MLPQPACWGAVEPVLLSLPRYLCRRYTTDDFVIMETTNSVYNKSLYDLIQPNCALTWQRVQVRGGGWRSGVGSRGGRSKKEALLHFN